MKIVIIAVLIGIGLSAQYVPVTDNVLGELAAKGSLSKEICGIDDKGGYYVMEKGKRKKVSRGKLIDFIRKCPDITESRKVHLLTMLGAPRNVSISGGY